MTPDPLEMVREYERTWPEAWSLVSKHRARHAEWSPYVHCPYGILKPQALRRLTTTKDVQFGCIQVAAITAWRSTLGIYRVEETLLDELWNTPLSGKLPTELLRYLPEWCVYIELPGRFVTAYGETYEIAGAWVGVTCSQVGAPETLFVLEHPVNNPTFASTSIVTLTPGEALSAEREKVLESIGPIVSVALYLCSAEPDITDEATRTRKPSRPADRWDKRGRPKFMPAAKPTKWQIGHRIGAELKRARDAHERESRQSLGTGARKVPHIRTAHWQTFWTGPRNRPELRVPRVHWIPPILVNAELAGDVKPVIRPVRSA